MRTLTISSWQRVWGGGDGYLNKEFYAAGQALDTRLHIVGIKAIGRRAGGKMRSQKPNGAECHAIGIQIPRKKRTPPQKKTGT